MKKPERVTVDEIDYEIYHMGPKDQIRLMKFIAKTIGGPAGVLASDDTPSGSFMDMDSKIIGLFIKSALENIDDEAIIEKIEYILKFSHRKNEQGNYVNVTMEKDFHGQLDHLFKLTGKSLEVNFGRFLGVNAGLLEKLKGKFAIGNVPSPSQVQ